MARTFSVDTRVSSSSLLARARRAARENGAALVGDEGSGRFSHELVKSDYRMVEQKVVVTITEKPRAAAMACGGGPLERALGLGVGTHRRRPLSRPTPCRSTPGRTTALPFCVCLDSDGGRSHRLQVGEGNVEGVRGRVWFWPR
jgi:hypothetical protein